MGLRTNSLDITPMDEDRPGLVEHPYRRAGNPSAPVIDWVLCQRDRNFRTLFTHGGPVRFPDRFLLSVLSTRNYKNYDIFKRYNWGKSPVQLRSIGHLSNYRATQPQSGNTSLCCPTDASSTPCLPGIPAAANYCSWGNINVVNVTVGICILPADINVFNEASNLARYCHGIGLSFDGKPF